MLRDRDDRELDQGDLRRQHEAVVVAVHHDDRADHAGGNAPRGLVRVLQRVVAARERDAEVLRPAVAEVVARAALQRDAVVHHRLDRVGGDRAGELLLLGLLARHGRDREDVLIELLIGAEHAERFLHGLLGGLVHRVALLPQELGGAQERARRFSQRTTEHHWLYSFGRSR